MDQDAGTREWVSAYLEWIDVQGVEGIVETRRVFVERRRNDRRAGGAETSREALLLSALRAESDCVHLLRQALESGRSTAAQAH